MFEYVPAVQGIHAVLVEFSPCPIGQAVQLVDFAAAAIRPVAHGVHAPPALVAVPGLQLTQAPPLPDVLVPAAQFMHKVTLLLPID